MYSHGIHVMFCCDCATRQRTQMDYDVKRLIKHDSRMELRESRENDSECLMRRSTRQHDVKPFTTRANKIA